MSPLVSVIIPSYNHEKFIAETLQSLLNQTYPHFEVIITDDCSTDNTVQEIEKFNDPRIHLFRFSRNRGAVAATNHCRQHAKGKYIALLSSDDIFLPNKLEKQINYMENHPNTAVVFSLAEMINETGGPFVQKDHFYYDIFNQPNRTRFEWLHYFFYHANCLCHPSALIRQSVFETIGSHNPCYSKLLDFDMWVRICLKYDIHILQEKLVKFRVLNNEMNASGDTPEKRIISEWEEAHILENFSYISSTEDLLKILPELKNDYNEFYEPLIPFYIAMLAIKVPSSVHNYFAIESLYKLLLSVPELLEEKVNFSFPDFFKLIGKSNIFHQQELTEMQSFKNWKIIQPLRWLKKLVSR